MSDDGNCGGPAPSCCGPDEQGKIPSQTCAQEVSGGDVASSSLGSSPRKPLHQEIEELKKAQQAARDAKKKATKDLRNAVKKKQRVMKKARELTNADLVEVITLRQQAAAQRAALKSEATKKEGEEEEVIENAEDPPEKKQKKQK